MTSSFAELPVVVIGAGPVGLAAAAHLAERGIPFRVLERGGEIAASVRSWGHVQLFSPWRYVVDQAAERLLTPTGWEAPDGESYPNGHALIDAYLAPLTAHPDIAPQLLFAHEVTGISRVGFDRLKTTGRDQAPFLLQLNTPDGETTLTARAVIDASGTYTAPNPLGASGLPAAGERANEQAIVYGIPDVLGAERVRYRGKRILVAGSGHSAFNAILDLALLAEQEPGTAITWVVRRGVIGQAYGGGENDALPARGRLGSRVRELVEGGLIDLVTGWRTERVERTPEGVVLTSGEQRLPPVDEIIVATGFRPNLAMLSEMRLSLDPIVEAPAPLAPLIDPNLHSCGSVPPHGIDELSHPEPGFYMVGMKSYGRAPTFLLLTGYEQVRSVVAGLAGDWKAARDVQLVLPETGVCSGPIAAGGGVVAGGSCCSTPAAASSRLVPTLISFTPLTAVATSDACCGSPAAAPSRSAPVQISLTPVAATAADSACCGAEAQTTCCGAEDKQECCGTTEVTTASSCGCS